MQFLLLSISNCIEGLLFWCLFLHCPRVPWCHSQALWPRHMSSFRSLIRLCLYWRQPTKSWTKQCRATDLFTLFIFENLTAITKPNQMTEQTHYFPPWYYGNRLLEFQISADTQPHRPPCLILFHLYLSKICSKIVILRSAAVKWTWGCSIIPILQFVTKQISNKILWFWHE